MQSYIDNAIVHETITIDLWPDFYDVFPVLSKFMAHFKVNFRS